MFAALRDGSALRNLACHIVLRLAPPDQWDFEDEVESLIIRRRWVGRNEIHTALADLLEDRLVLSDWALVLLRDKDASYAWARLLPGAWSRQRIGWRAGSLVGPSLLATKRSYVLVTAFMLQESAHTMDGRTSLRFWATARRRSSWERCSNSDGRGFA